MNPHQIDQLVGVKIRARRLELGLSQTELANKVGASRRKIQSYEGGQRVHAAGLYFIAKALDQEIIWFFQEDDLRK
jgi:transcriptional regulator with XRE-family HTH domain